MARTPRGLGRVGPWVGFLFWAAVYFALLYAAPAIDWAYPASREMNLSFLAQWSETWPGWLLGWALIIGVFSSIAYGWLVVAAIALCRARRLGQCWRALGRGLVAARVRRFAVRHLLGAHGGLAGLLLRSEDHADPRRGRNPGRDLRLRGHRHLRRGGAAASCSRPSSWPGCWAWPCSGAGGVRGVENQPGRGDSGVESVDGSRHSTSPQTFGDWNPAGFGRTLGRHRPSGGKVLYRG